MTEYDVLVVGCGAAGMAAALAAKEAGAEKLLIAERESAPGGILRQCIHKGFGLGYCHEDLTGPEYAARFIERLAGSGIELRLDTTVLELRHDRRALLSSEVRIEEIAFRRCVLATGCRERAIGSLPIAGTRPAGVFSAGTAQRMVNLMGLDIGKRVIILGSGDIGMIMARRFTLLGKEVVAMVEKEAAPGGLARNIRSCIEAYSIPVLTRSTLVRIHGEGRLSGVTVRNLDSGEERFIDCDTLIVSVGLIPERELLSGFDALPDWLRLCGNCDYVHEIVDTVSTQAEKLGRNLFQALHPRFEGSPPLKSGGFECGK